MSTVTLVVGLEHKGMRADKFLVENFPDVSRSKLQKLFEREQVWVDEEIVKKNYALSVGEEVEFEHPDSLFKDIEAKPVDFDILYEDEHFFAINKQPGLTIHPVSMDDEQTTVANGVLAKLGDGVRGIGPSDRPCIVHRLDKDTSGVLLIAKTQEAFDSLKEIFANRKIEKEYLAVVKDTPDLLAGSCIEPIMRNPRNPLKMVVAEEGYGKEARTDWERVAIDEEAKIGLVRCFLHTGRTHQARVHMAFLEHPVLGDRMYGYQGLFAGRTLLHAHRVALPHPVTGEPVEIIAPVPADMLAFEKLWEKQED